MLIELAHFALILAFAIAILQTIVPLVGASKGWRGWMAMAEPAAVSQFILISFSFAVLTWAFVVSDFSVRLVYLNSHTDKPLIYKISGVWGNHEGSLLLWALILTLFGACAVWFGQGLPETLRARVLAVQGSIGVAFLAFMLFTSNPFLRLVNAPMNGRDLNPLLQDPGLAFHPPFLYLGYVGLSMTFSFAVAALLEGRVDAAWGRWVRPWTLAAWVFLTIGIALGSWWAYYELGWGGFWFWDPVENASFMPWLIAAALLHPERGVFILLILAIFLGGALTLYAARASALEAKGVFGTVSRESALVVNNILLAVSAFVVFIGTIWPLFAEMALGRTLSVGPPFFDAAFSPFMVALAVVLPLGSLLAWKRGTFKRSAKPLGALLILAVAGAAFAFAIQSGRSALGPIGLALGIWVVGGSLIDLWLRGVRGTLAERMRRILRLPRADWGKAVSHIGVGVTVFGVAAILAWEQEDIRVANVGETWTVGAYEITLQDVRRARGPNYTTTLADMSIARGGREIAMLSPEKRFYPVAKMPTTEAAIRNGILRDIYVVIGDAQSNGGYAVRVYIKPFANWIWGGAILMALGGALSLTDRRMRIGAAARKPVAVAAE